MYNWQDNVLNFSLAESRLDWDLTTPPSSLRDVALDKDSLYELSLNDPKAFHRISRTLSHWPIVTVADAAAVLSYLSQGRKISVVDPRSGVLGELADKFQRVLGLQRRYAIPFSSGTNALNAGYRALGLRRGDPVAVVAYTFHATVTPVLELGANPIMMDASPLDGNITLEIIDQTLTWHPDVKIVAVNHNWGVPISDIARIKTYLAQRDVKLLEDCSHAHGAMVEGLPVGSFGDIAVFSLQANKTVTGGEGAICLADDPAINARVLLVGHESATEQTYGISINPSARETGLHGLQFRMHPLAATLALSQLDRLEEVIANRRDNFEYFQSKIRGVQCVQMPVFPLNGNSSYYRLRAAYLPEKNRGRSSQEYVRLLRSFGVDVHVDSSGPLSRKAIFQRHFSEYGSQALENRHYYRFEDFPGINEYCRSRLVFPVFSRALPTVRGVIDVMAAHMNKLNDQ